MPPRPLAETTADRDVVLVVKIEGVPTVIVVVLGNFGVTVVQLFTRLAIFTLPTPVAALYPALWLNADSNAVVDSERMPNISPEVLVKQFGVPVAHAPPLLPVRQPVLVPPTQVLDPTCEVRLIP